MKQQHNMKKGESRIFYNFAQLQIFSETYEYQTSDFKFTDPGDNTLKMTRQ